MQPRRGEAIMVDWNMIVIVAAETVGETCGVALLNRELRQQHPFVQTR